MEYIPDKKLYSAVMFALKMCPSIEMAYTYKIRRASDYYHVSYEDVLKIVQKELWKRATVKAKERSDQWYTVYHHDTEAMGVPIFKNFIFICPQCGAKYVYNINDFDVDKRYVSSCSCGFADRFQRTFIRKETFEKQGGIT